MREPGVDGDERRVLEAFERECPMPSVEDILRWQRRHPRHGDAIADAGTKAIEAQSALHAGTATGDGRIRRESRYLYALWRARRDRGDPDADAEPTGDPDCGLFATPDASRDSILAEMITACRVPTLRDVSEWQSRHPSYRREIALFGADVMWTAFVGGSSRAPTVETLVAALGLAFAPLQKGRVKDAGALER